MWFKSANKISHWQWSNFMTAYPQGRTSAGKKWPLQKALIRSYSNHLTLHKSCLQVFRAVNTLTRELNCTINGKAVKSLAREHNCTKEGEYKLCFFFTCLSTWSPYMSFTGYNHSVIYALRTLSFLLLRFIYLDISLSVYGLSIWNWAIPSCLYISNTFQFSPISTLHYKNQWIISTLSSTWNTRFNH